MARDTGLVQRLIAFLKKPGSLEYERREDARNPYDDYQSSAPSEPGAYSPDAAAQEAYETMFDDGGHTPAHGSRLDALVMRALKQFNAQLGFVIRYDKDGRMRYLTGRNLSGRYVDHTEVNPDRRALFLTLDSGESQLFVHTQGNTPCMVLCGPLWIDNQVIGVFYLDNPARSRLHRGVFDLFCEQVARMLSDGVG
jgi:hypothetical protein